METKEWENAGSESSEEEQGWDEWEEGEEEGVMQSLFDSSKFASVRQVVEYDARTYKFDVHALQRQVRGRS